MKHGMDDLKTRDVEADQYVFFYLNSHRFTSPIELHSKF